MKDNEVRTRFAPSPTGKMHVGNLRTALYEFLIAKSLGGRFILRIEDTDRERYVEGATTIIYRTLKEVGIRHDEGPDIGGPFGPYTQSERIALYKPYALELIRKDKAYFCFCSKKTCSHNGSSHHESDFESSYEGYDRHCRELSEDTVKQSLSEKIPYVIRQKMPLLGSTTFHDAVFGDITVSNAELDDQILIKSDGYPTYNFANVIDDHLMEITHVVRGSEYLSSAPKYNLLYEYFDWPIPVYVHLPLILGKNPDGSTSKLSKRHGSFGFEELKQEGYLTTAIVNYISLLGWCPKDNTELMTIDDLLEKFSVSGISKSPSVFDFEKLNWMNAEYIRQMDTSDFHRICVSYYQQFGSLEKYKEERISQLVQARITRLNEIPGMVSFFFNIDPYSPDLFIHKKMKTDRTGSLISLQAIHPILEALSDWSEESIHDLLIHFAVEHGMKNGQIMWPVRTALSGLASSPGGAIELLYILGKEESLRRIQFGINILYKSL
jgi:glutamyl-tRNA synthetase